MTKPPLSGAHGTVEFTRHLRTIRFRKRLTWVLLLLLIPVFLLIVSKGDRKIVVSDEPLVVVFLALLIPYILYMNLVTFSRCPRCHKLFHIKWLCFFLYYGNTFSRTCLNCGLSYRNV